MNIIHIGAMVNGKDEGFSHALRKVATNYVEINPGDTMIGVKMSEIWFDPDLIFLQLQTETIQGRGTVEFLGPMVQQFKDKGAFVLNWNGDIRQITPHWMLQFTPYCNLTAFSNQRDIDTFAISGHPVRFLQIGIDPEIFNALGAPAHNMPDIIFMGNHYGTMFPLGGFRKSIAEVMRRRYGKRFGLYGNGYQDADGNFNVQNNEVTKWQGAEAAIYRACKIALSISHFQVERYTSDRLLRILGCGALSLTHWYPSIEKEFTPDVHLKTFNTIDELLVLTDYYLEHEDEAKNIGREAGELIATYHTYDAMVENILSFMP